MPVKKRSGARDYSKSRINRDFNLIIIAVAVVLALAVISSFNKEPEKYHGDDISPGTVSFGDIISTDSESLRFHLLNKDIRWVSTAAACEATVADDASRCDIIVDPSSRKWCTDEYEDYKLILENISFYLPDCSLLQGKPELEGLFDEDVCSGLKKRSCSGLTGDKSAFCRAVLEDPLLCIDFDEPECLRNFALSRAYILENPELCEVQGLSISQIEACKGIVRRDCQDIFNRLSTDLSRIDYIKRNSDYGKCSLVTTSSLKSLCSDTSLDYMDVYNMME